jgi:hypothetical protein
MAEKEKKVVKFAEKVIVYSTGETKHLAKGEKMSVHPELAKKLISAGKATEKAVK